MSEWLKGDAKKTDALIADAARQRQQELTKPPGALGRLEDLAIELAAMQGRLKPELERIHISIFAADHGVAARGVSAFPQTVTTEMVRNFAAGGAAISVLARSIDAVLEVMNLGTVNDPGALPGVLDLRIAPGTRDFCQHEAMTEEELHRALNAGRQAAERARAREAGLFIGGEMGIGNTTAATAIACALLDKPVEDIVGPGTGLDHKGVLNKAEVIKIALQRHKPMLNEPLQALRVLGGFEIAGLVGAFVACARMGLPVLVDGFIAGAAALVADRLCPGARDWFIYAHASAEPGHQAMMAALDAKPLLDLGMRLGEGSGAAAAVPLLQLACRLHNDMATFAEAAVSAKVAD